MLPLDAGHGKVEAQAPPALVAPERLNDKAVAEERQTNYECL